MSTSKKVLLASDVLIAFIDRANSKHMHAVAYFRYFAREHFILYSTVSNILATDQNLRERISPTLAKDFLRAISISSINILFPEESEFKLAVKTLLNYRSLELTFDEALTASVADKRAIPSICTLSYIHPLFGISAFYLPV